jgi:hypothetical protein
MAKWQLCPTRYWPGGAAAPPKLRLSDNFRADLKLNNTGKVVKIFSMQVWTQKL